VAEAARILIVEDDPVVGDVFRQFLPLKGYSVDVAADAESALVMLANAAFDLVVADKNLPGIDGVELLRRIKDRSPDLDVIIMTAYADMKSLLDAVSSGVYDYLLKPFDSLEEVAHKVDRAIEKRRILKENRRLVDHLQQANSQIEAMNRTLEAQVAERTRQLEQTNERLQQLTITDDVTGLYNQRFLFGRLSEEFERARRHQHSLCVMMLDIDYFKNVNDSHDHIFGSQVLRRVGAVLREGVRAIDLLIRYGGDEFVVLMPETAVAEALPVGERVRSLLAATDVGDAERPYHVTVSVGVAGLDESPSDNAATLLRRADTAMYLAKGRGRNQVAVGAPGADANVATRLGRR